MTHTREAELEAVKAYINDFILENNLVSWTEMDNEQRKTCGEYITLKLIDNFEDEERFMLFFTFEDDNGLLQIGATDLSDVEKIEADIQG